MSSCTRVYTTRGCKGMPPASVFPLLVSDSSKFDALHAIVLPSCMTTLLHKSALGATQPLDTAIQPSAINEPITPDWPNQPLHTVPHDGFFSWHHHYQSHVFPSHHLSSRMRSREPAHWESTTTTINLFPSSVFSTPGTNHPTAFQRSAL